MVFCVCDGADHDQISISYSIMIMWSWSRCKIMDLEHYCDSVQFLRGMRMLFLEFLLRQKVPHKDIFFRCVSCWYCSCFLQRVTRYDIQPALHSWTSRRQVTHCGKGRLLDWMRLKEKDFSFDVDRQSLLLSMRGVFSRDTSAKRMERREEQHPARIENT